MHEGETLAANLEQILSIREEELPIRATIRAVIFDRQDNVALLIRRAGISRELETELPGGKVDVANLEGESDPRIEWAMYSEIEQETGLTIIGLRKAQAEYEYRSRETRLHVGFVALARGVKPEINYWSDPDGDHVGGGWKPRKEALLLLDESRHVRLVKFAVRYKFHKRV